MKQDLARAEDNLALAAGEKASLELEKERHMKRLRAYMMEWVLQERTHFVDKYTGHFVKIHRTVRIRRRPMRLL